MTRDVTVQCMVLRCDRALMQYIQIHVIRVPMLCSVYLSFRRQLTIRQAQTLGILFGPLCFSVVMEAVAPPPPLISLYRILFHPRNGRCHVWVGQPLHAWPMKTPLTRVPNAADIALSPQ